MNIKFEKKTLFTKENLVFAFAPLEPYTANPILREMMGINGAELVFRPKVLPQHLLKAKIWQKREKIIDIENCKTPLNKQVFDCFQFIARLDDPIKPAVEFLNHDADKLGISVIDLNFSCPGYKVLPNRRGGELLQNPEMIIEIISKFLKYSDLSISIKIRNGYTSNNNCFNLCRMIKKEFGNNIGWITVNRAYVRMKNIDINKLISDNSSFKMAIDAVENTIPIIANGGFSEIKQIQQISEEFRNYPISGLMIGRGALGNQSIFSVNKNKKSNLQSIFPHSIELLENVKTQIYLNINQCFQLIQKYVGSSSGMYCSFGELKRLFFWYVKYYYESQGQQIPSGFGFSHWEKMKLSPTRFIEILNMIFPKIELKIWENQLKHLF